VQVEEVLLEGTSDGGLTTDERWIPCEGERKLRVTLPLALRPVNQIVTPFWPSSLVRNSAFTEPIPPSQMSKELQLREPGWVTCMEGEIGGHWRESWKRIDPCRLMGDR
jgi:hypothetical protein